MTPWYGIRHSRSRNRRTDETVQIERRQKLTKVRVAGFSVSIDGFAAGPEQSLANPLGKSGPELFQWFFPTRTFRAMVGEDGGTTGLDD